MRTRDPFGEALSELRMRLRQGELRPGAPLVVMDLAQSLGLSATPVREALAFLAGEGLIDRPQFEALLTPEHQIWRGDAYLILTALTVEAWVRRWERAGRA